MNLPLILTYWAWVYFMVNQQSLFLHLFTYKTYQSRQKHKCQWNKWMINEYFSILWGKQTVAVAPGGHQSVENKLPPTAKSQTYLLPQMLLCSCQPVFYWIQRCKGGHLYKLSMSVFLMLSLGACAIIYDKYGVSCLFSHIHCLIVTEIIKTFNQ